MAAGRALHRYLLPPRVRHSWLPYIWLFWLLGFFQKWFDVPIEPVEFALALGTVAVFLPLYFNGYTERYAKARLGGTARPTNHLACDARGIEFAVDRPVMDLPEHHEAVLAMCLREAITNVVRHSDASHCRASLSRKGPQIRLTVADDGRGGVIQEGAGLAGMRERVKQAGGEMSVESRRGVTVTVRVPLADADPRGSKGPVSGQEVA